MKIEAGHALNEATGRIRVTAGSAPCRPALCHDTPGLAGANSSRVAPVLSPRRNDFDPTQASFIDAA